MTKILFAVACNYNENSTAHPCAIQFCVSERMKLFFDKAGNFSVGMEQGAFQLRWDENNGGEDFAFERDMTLTLLTFNPSTKNTYCS